MRMSFIIFSVDGWQTKLLYLDYARDRHVHVPNSKVR